MVTTVRPATLLESSHNTANLSVTLIALTVFNLCLTSLLSEVAGHHQGGQVFGTAATPKHN